METANGEAYPKRNFLRFPSASNSSFLDKQPPHSKEQHQRQYSPPPFHKIAREDRHISQFDIGGMNGVPLHTYRPVYDNQWQLPASPLSEARGQGSHDTTRSRLADEHLVRSSQPPMPRSQQGVNNQYPRVRNRRRSIDSSSDTDDSYRARRHTKGQRRSRGGRSQRGSRAAHLAQPQQQQQVDAPKTGLEAIITPLRLGVLLGCFDIIGGSLSVWMTRKRFAKGAQHSAAGSGRQQQPTVERQSGVNSNRPRRPTTTHRHERRARYHPYDSSSGSVTDSDYDERQWRTAEHVREQRRLDYDRNAGYVRAAQQGADARGNYGRRR